jgi:hypothetical protein
VQDPELSPRQRAACCIDEFAHGHDLAPIHDERVYTGEPARGEIGEARDMLAARVTKRTTLRETGDDVAQLFSRIGRVVGRIHGAA